MKLFSFLRYNFYKTKSILLLNFQIIIATYIFNTFSFLKFNFIDFLQKLITSSSANSTIAFIFPHIYYPLFDYIFFNNWSLYSLNLSHTLGTTKLSLFIISNSSGETNLAETTSSFCKIKFPISTFIFTK